MSLAPLLRTSPTIRGRVVAGLLTFVPGRIMHAVAFGS
jgi:uncharacterized membrane protein